MKMLVKIEKGKVSQSLEASWTDAVIAPCWTPVDVWHKYPQINNLLSKDHLDLFHT